MNRTSRLLALVFLLMARHDAIAVPEDCRPTISKIPDQTFGPNTFIYLISLTVNDAKTPAEKLVVSAGSDNQDLLPNSSIRIGAGPTGDGSRRGMTCKPNTNRSGVAQVTVTATNEAGCSASTTFKINVPNSPPSISAILNQNWETGGSTGPIVFTVSDQETPPDSLVLEKNSSNKTLVPNENILLGGSGTNRTVTVTGAPDQSGSTTITITVWDAEGQEASTTFTFYASNGHPLISSIPDQVISRGGSTGPLGFTVDTLDAPAASAVLTKSSSNTAFVPDENIVFGGSGANRTVTVIAAPDQQGSTTVTITVRNSNGKTDSTRFVVATPIPQQRFAVISAIQNQTTRMNTPMGPVSFVAADSSDGAATLRIAASSSNRTLVPEANIVIGGNGPKRTLVITPARDQIGTTTITITATTTNLGTIALSASSSFTLTVVGPGPQTLSSIPNQTSYVNDPRNAGLQFSIGDEAEAALSNVFARSSNQRLIPDNSIILSGTGARRTVFIQPAADQAGTATITITVVSPDGKAASTTFNWTVIPRLPEVWNPRITSARQFQFDVTGEIVGKAVIIEASPDLREWMAIATNTPSAPQFQFVNPATNRFHRFFRALISP